MICIDTQILIWGVQGAQSEGAEGKAEQATRFIKSLRDRGVRILIPAPVLTEYLVYFPPDEQEAQRRVLHRNFVVGAFDVIAAMKAAEISGRIKDVMRGNPVGDRPTKHALKVDAMILAVAITNGAKTIYTDNDRDFRTIAGQDIIVEPMPEIRPNPLPKGLEQRTFKEAFPFFDVALKAEVERSASGNRGVEDGSEIDPD